MSQGEKIEPHLLNHHYGGCLSYGIFLCVFFCGEKVQTYQDKRQQMHCVILSTLPSGVPVHKHYTYPKCLLQCEEKKHLDNYQQDNVLFT